MTASSHVCSHCACSIPANGSYCQKDQTLWCQACAASELNLSIGHQQLIKMFLMQALVIISSWGLVLVVGFFLPTMALWVAAMLATWATHQVLNSRQKPGPEIQVMEDGKPVTDSEDDAFPSFLRFALLLRHRSVAFSLLVGFAVAFVWDYLRRF